MSGKSAARVSQRLRAQGQWAMIVGVIDLIACAIGLVQLWGHGVVSIRPGHLPASGRDAAGLLLAVALVGAFFVVFAIVRLRRARRLAARQGPGPAP